MLCERRRFGLGRKYSVRAACAYSYFFRHTVFATETNRAKPPSKLGSSFRPAFWLGVLKNGVS